MRIVLWCATAPVVAMLRFAPAHAQTLTASTPCFQVTEMMDSGLSSNVATVVAYINKDFAVLDREYIDHGDQGILSKLSQDGLTGLDAAVSVECRNAPNQPVGAAAFMVYDGVRGLQTTLGVIPPRRPDFLETVAGWTITGTVLPSGLGMSCRMTKETKDSEYGYIAAMDFSQSQMSMHAMLVKTTDMSNTANAQVNLTFDKSKPIRLPGTFFANYVGADISSGSIEEMQARVALWQSSARLQISVTAPGEKTETLKVNLSGVKAAFDENGLCMKQMVELGTAKLKAKTSD